MTPSYSETGTTDSSRRRIVSNDPSTPATAIVGTSHKGGWDATGSTVPNCEHDEDHHGQDEEYDDDTLT